MAESLGRRADFDRLSLASREGGASIGVLENWSVGVVEHWRTGLRPGGRPPAREAGSQPTTVNNQPRAKHAGVKYRVDLQRTVS